MMASWIKVQTNLPWPCPALTLELPDGAHGFDLIKTIYTVQWTRKEPEDNICKS